MLKLTKLTLRGYKSIKDATIDFGSMNVLIGANGAGKSNLISFFRMISEMMDGRFQVYVGVNGRGHSFVYRGMAPAHEMSANVVVESSDSITHYHAAWANTSGDTLLFQFESLGIDYKPAPHKKTTLNLGSGRFESQLSNAIHSNQDEVHSISKFFQGIGVYHFHDTTVTARMKRIGYVADHSPLQHDGGNIAAFLYQLEMFDTGSYRRIVSTIRLIAPFFKDFYLEPEMPNCNEVALNWRHVDSDELFGPHEFSDGTLRAICLIALLLQPVEKLPSLIVVDEPELGLHPYALGVIADLLHKASNHTQVVVSTQSSAFLDHFEPRDIIVVDRKDTGTTFTRPDAEKLEAWLAEYSLGEVWDKNIIAGGPH